MKELLWRLKVWWRMSLCYYRCRFWPLLVFLVVTIVMLQVMHIALLTRLEAKEAREEKQGLFVASRQLQGRTFNNVLTEMQDRVKNSFRLDRSGTYHLVDNFLASEHVTLGRDSHDISIVTQCSSDNLHHLIDLSQRWNGPISVSVFTFDDDFINAVYRLIHFHFCYNHIFRHVSFHLVFPISRAPKHFVEMSRIQFDCSSENLKQLSRKNEGSGPSTFTNSVLNYALKDVPYPVNLLRNLAINYAPTPYVFMIDIDLLPSSNLRRVFQTFISHPVKKSQQSTNTTLVESLDAFVVPVFEIKSSETRIPNSKAELLKAWTKGTVRPFYWEPCEKCQRPTDYQAWRLISGKEDGSLTIGYTVERVDPWEPFYIAKTSIPLYDERFKQYGFNRISQVCEMHVAGYKFHVLDNAFLVHKGFKTKGQFHAKKDAENAKSRDLYRTFKDELKVRYPDVSQRC